MRSSEKPDFDFCCNFSYWGAKDFWVYSNVFFLVFVVLGIRLRASWTLYCSTTEQHPQLFSNHNWRESSLRQHHFYDAKYLCLCWSPECQRQKKLELLCSFMMHSLSPHFICCADLGTVETVKMKGTRILHWVSMRWGGSGMWPWSTKVCLHMGNLWTSQ